MNDRVLIGAIAVLLLALRSPPILRATDALTALGMLFGTGLGGLLIGTVVVRGYRAIGSGDSHE
ncbi:hypothetical protein GJ633_09340 [Halorubrum sp. CBA1125]|uniref:hypothetical protein n=1 Tax=Halorubrum sp. CBA1125 TaxID=2668072 RepID=UPI0012E8278F|nr:hypothetical protein [Halorubrum sp. CBA1125]MUW14843.1 hypothetical protein [Halorubrum sp. CBA1125]